LIDGRWQVTHRANQMLNGDPAAPGLLGRLMEGPVSA
jgi:hypothetical protein